MPGKNEVGIVLYVRRQLSCVRISESRQQQDLRGGDGCVRRKARRKIAGHRRRRRVPTRLRDRLRHLCVCAAAAALDARHPGAVRALALHDSLVRLRPHVHVVQVDARAGRAVSADELDRGACDPVADVSVPVLQVPGRDISLSNRGGRGERRTEKVMSDSATPAPEPGVCEDQYWSMLRPYAVSWEMKFSKVTLRT